MYQIANKRFHLSRKRSIPLINFSPYSKPVRFQRQSSKCGSAGPALVSLTSEWALNIVDKCQPPLRPGSSALLFQQGGRLKLDLGRQHFAAGPLLERLR
jgi:hypothetical protein